MIKLFVCLECGEIFSDPISWSEDRGECFGFPSYEKFSGSPCCNGSYIKAYTCSHCEDYITTENYIKIGCDRYCENCYDIYELGEED